MYDEKFIMKVCVYLFYWEGNAMDKQQTQQRFRDIYGKNGELLTFHAPGRVNLIGEHTDYNGGFVFPCALSFGTYGVVRKREDNVLNFASTDMPLRISTSFNDMVYNKEHGWVNYLKGVVAEFQKLGLGEKLGGLDILISGNIPNGSGLSSSASIELLMSVILNDCFDCGLPMVELVKLSQRAENQFVGVNCGIMDQYSIGFGKKENAILLDCREITHQYVPLVLDGCKIVIANTNKKRGLTDSKYNERRSECEQAVAALQQRLAITCLRDVSAGEFEANRDLIRDDIVAKRAEHVVYEIDRTLRAVNMLKANNLVEFGKLMVQSHDSLRDLYEVTGEELDALMEAANAVDGTLGSRMTGAGFGGCTVSIVRDEAVGRFIEQTGKQYARRTGLTADFYIAESGDGAMRVE